MSKVQIPSVKLNNGRDMPALGYGTWLGLDDEGKFDVPSIPKLKEALSYAIDVGYRHIDTAHLYRVEPEVGEVINQKIKEGIITREDVFITTKVWQHFHKEADVEKSLRASLRRLNMEYVDMVLVHWPMSIDQEGVDEKIDYLETWRGFESVLAKGLTKGIGVSNFNVDQMKRLIANSKVLPACNQVELNLNLGQKELVDYCRSQSIVPVAYSPFGTMVPSRSTAGSPEPKLDNPTMVAMGKKYGKTVSQIALRYLYECGIVAIPKSVTKTRILENASIFDFKLDEVDFATLMEFDNGYRTVRPVFWQEYQNYPFDKIGDVDLTTSNEVGIPYALRKWKNGATEDIE